MSKEKVLTLFLALMIILPLASTLTSAREATPVILVDLSHGESSGGLDVLFKVVPEVQWVILVPSEEDINSLPTLAVTLAKDIWVGTFADIAENLQGVDGIIIGQPAAEFTPDEIEVINTWFHSGGGLKFLWLAGDSDYPAQGGNLEIAQHTINDILETLGAQLRHDYVSVEDPVSNAQRTYRVVGIVDSEIPALNFGAKKVLFHGPGALAYVTPDGEWKSLTGEKPQNIFNIVRTTDQGTIVEHQPSQPGAPGDVGQAYAAGDTGVFILMAAELMTVNVEGTEVPRWIVVSGETPYGGYQPMITYQYYGVDLDGPRFIRNCILYFSGLKGELGVFEQVYSEAKMAADLANTTMDQLTAELTQVKEQVATALNQGKQMQGNMQNLQSTLNDLQNSLNANKDKLSQLEQQLSSLQQQISDLQSQVQAAQQAAEASASKGTALTGAIIGIIALLVAGAALLRKPS